MNHPSSVQERAFYEQVLIPLLELFALVDDVYTEENALSSAHVYKTAGRIYRGWKDCRKALDPTFDPKSREFKITYWNPKTLTMKKCPSTPATDSKMLSLDRFSMTERNHLMNALRGNFSA